MLIHPRPIVLQDCTCSYTDHIIHVTKKVSKRTCRVEPTRYLMWVFLPPANEVWGKVMYLMWAFCKIISELHVVCNVMHLLLYIKNSNIFGITIVRQNTQKLKMLAVRFISDIDTVYLQSLPPHNWPAYHCVVWGKVDRFCTILKNNEWVTEMHKLKIGQILCCCFFWFFFPRRPHITSFAA